MNQVSIVGRMTKDPELKYLQSGKSICNLSLAVNRKFKKDEVDFFECVAWGKTGELIAEYVKKGDQIAVIGSLRQETWEKDGQKRSKIVVNVENITFIGGSKKKEETSQVPSEEEFPF